MGGRLGIMLILILSFILMISDARFIEVEEVIVMQIEDDVLVTQFKNPALFTQDEELLQSESLVASSADPGLSVQNDKLCSLCEEFTAQAVEYLKQNKTQAEIIRSLHQACSQLHSLEQQCMLLVDYYAPLFFSELGLISPEKFCKKVNLCKKDSAPQRKSVEPCIACQQAIVEILLKLRDPDAQLEIVEALLKLCNRADNYAQKCKKLVFEYGPAILVNAEKFLETTDICSYIYACKASGELVTTQGLHNQVEISDS